MVALGIDLGTTYSVMAYIDESGQPKVIPNQEGAMLTPSVVSFNEHGLIVGEEAKDNQRNGSSDIAAFFKRLMGDEYYLFEYQNKTYDTIDLSSFVLKKLKADAEVYLGQTINDVVITVPAYFNNVQREATIDAGKRAGMNVLSIINEPTAAAIAYGFKEGTGNRHILVYDLGGGTFDVTIAKVDDTSIKVLSTDGDHNLGGKDFDDRLVLFVCEQFEREFGLDPLEDEGTLNEILASVEQAKIRLTHLRKTSITIFYKGHKGSYEVTQELFEELAQDLLERTWNLANVAVMNAYLNWADIDNIILVGGSTRMPMVSKFIEEQTNKLPHFRINVDEVVAIGAAYHAHMKTSESVQDKPRFSLAAAKKVEDVMSHSLGMIAINEDYSSYINSMIIPKNKRIPAMEKKPYKLETSPSRENSLDVYVTQGESADVQDAIILGKYVVKNIPHTNVQPAIIEVSYSYDQNGIVQVSAMSKSTKTPLSVHVEKVDNLGWMMEPPKKVEVIEQEISVMMVMDTSYSMDGTAITESIKAAHQFVNDLGLERFSIGLTAFANRVRTLQFPTKNEHDLRNQISMLQSYVKDGTLGYGTDGEPLEVAYSVLRKLEGPRFIIVLTDGQWGKDKEAIQVARMCKEAGIEIIAVGFGSANKKFLNKIATSDANALFTNLQQLVQSFTKIAQVVTEKSLSYRDNTFHR
ncbi:Hsp70 family protein [Litchfieldia alkalitelluris]|uniref:Hsp70 family protein n=1 Tax=Litchfieldia alkalitelluris TaxID=304268 RepID=UPI0009969DA6|nr:Hsp70 family protein [Litchfieldia alkalitelluris]